MTELERAADEGRVLRVTGLFPNITEKDLVGLFERYGVIQSVKIVKDPETAFVVMNHDYAAVNAIEWLTVVRRETVMARYNLSKLGPDVVVVLVASRAEVRD